MQPGRVPRLTAITCLSMVVATTVAAQPPPLPQPLTLDAALEFAAAHYPAVRASMALVTASAADVVTARTATLPRLDAVWQANRATVNNVTGLQFPQPALPGISGPPFADTSGRSVWGSAVGALLSWEPLDLGQRDAVVREAESVVARARAGEALTRLDVQHAVGTAFLAVVAAQQMATAAEADLERRNVLARTARVLADSQLRAGAEASRAEAELAGARTRVIKARHGVLVAHSMLARMVGASTTIGAVEAARLLTAAPSAPAAAGPVERHPLAVARRAAIDAVQARDDVLATTTRPRLFVQSSVFARGTGANVDGTLDGGAAGLGLERANWAVGLQVVFPNLFEVPAVRARRAATAATVRAETAHYDDGLLTIAHERRVAEAAIEAARAVALNTPVQLDAARLTEQQARARFAAGLTSVIEIAEAQNLLATAEYQDAAARVEVWRALLAQAVASGDLAPFIALVRGTGTP
jgi:outer membrane protein